MNNLALKKLYIRLKKSRLLSGFLRLNGKDITQLQKILDPIILTGLFMLLQPYLEWKTPFASLPSWCLVAFAVSIVLAQSSIYSSYRHRSLIKLLRKISSRWLLILSLLLLATYFNKSTSSFSRIATTTWALSGWMWLITSHILIRKILRYYRTNGGNSRLIVYWGTPKAAASFAKQIASNPWMGYRIVAWFSPVMEETKSHIQTLPACAGGRKDLEAWLKKHKVDWLVFSYIDTDESKLEQMVSLFGDTSVSVLYAPHWSHPTMRFSTELVGIQPCIELWGSEQRWLDRQIKRLIDLTLCSVGVIIISPLLLCIAIAIKLSSPGPILYRQNRYGLDGKNFKCLKFRSMYVEKNIDLSEVKQATSTDPRVTPIGSFLRRWSLDELPQIFNVLAGDMSLVGPRPHAAQHNEIYRKVIPGYMQRHSFKPGITGLAQISGWRGETPLVSDMENRINADLTYQRDWSLILDLKILVKTFLLLRSGNNY